MQEGEIPQSDLLNETDPQSIGILLSKDPFKFTTKDREAAIAALRAQRIKWEAAEKAGLAKPKSAPKIAAAAKSLISPKSADDLGI